MPSSAFYYNIERSLEDLIKHAQIPIIVIELCIIIHIVMEMSTFEPNLFVT